MGNIVCEKPPVWQPKEIVDLGDGCKLGITSDDGYYLVLSPSYRGSWKPSNWIPAKVAKRLGELAAVQTANESPQLLAQPVIIALPEANPQHYINQQASVFYSSSR
ncbi:MAG: hypothetical protein A2Z75_08815 [Chloroflexi bacterium RBG_13_50_10]|nr:MAG: hypothetical protein A2Z75_08815 [Chloroflexi bacterium RBG_13_50_10]